MSDSIVVKCHCDGVHVKINNPDGLKKLVSCNCSICSRKNAVMGTAAADELEVVKGADLLTEYKFHTDVAAHYFCSRCGIYTHNRRRSDPNIYSFNIACVDGVNVADCTDITYIDGLNHPLDKKQT